MGILKKGVGDIWSGVTGLEATLELYAVCTPQLRRALFDFLGQDTLAVVDESSLLAHIQQEVAKGKDTVVHSQEFDSMMQLQDEPIRCLLASCMPKQLRWCSRQGRNP